MGKKALLKFRIGISSVRYTIWDKLSEVDREGVGGGRGSLLGNRSIRLGNLWVRKQNLGRPTWNWRGLQIACLVKLFEMVLTGNYWKFGDLNLGSCFLIQEHLCQVAD